MQITQDDIQYYGFIKSKCETICDQCGEKIHVGDFYYRRLSNPAIHCVKCRKLNKDKWRNRNNNYNALVKAVAHQLDTHGFIDVTDLKNTNNFDKTQLNKIQKKIADLGYVTILEKNAGHYSNNDDHECWKLKYSPIVQDFLESLIYSEDSYELIADRFKESAKIISTIILNITGTGKIIENGSNQLLEYISELKEQGVESVFNSVYVGRISFDDTVYNEIIKDNRVLVISYLIEKLFDLSDRVTLGEAGSYFENGVKKQYSIVTDDEDIQDETGCDLDIVASADAVLCFDNNDEDSCYGLLEYLGTSTDKNSIDIIEMIKEILNRGF